ncbi:hypothetical protein ACFLYM_00180 [Chloroflexota bacterium]
MTELLAMEWPGLSGRKYVYWIYDIGTVFAPAEGNYIFMKEVSSHTWEPVYIGQTADLHDLPENEYTMPCIRLEGATHVCVHESSEDEDVRRAEVSDLIRNYYPVCNNQPQLDE